jgi:DNA-binding CsgD family transcriptional regulator
MGELLSSEEIAANLKVTKVNITFTKTRIIRMLRHSSLSNKILNGI